MASGMDLCSMYPITPATSASHYLSDVFESVGALLAVPVFGLITWLAAGKTLEEFASAAEASSGLAVPSWTISIVLPIGFGLLTLRLALNAIGYLATLATGRTIQPLPPISGSEGEIE